MATTCSCCIFNNFPTIDLSDPCVCNAPIGATLVTTLGDIYVRTTITNPCSLADWTLGGGFTFSITDAFANIQSIAANNTVTFLGQNGVNVQISPTDTVTIGGLTTFGTGAPVGFPSVPTDVNFYLDTNTGNLYVWSPVGPTWIGPLISGSGTTISAICATPEGTFNAFYPMRVFQDQAGSCEIVRHEHKPIAAFEVLRRTALTMTLDGGYSNSTLNLSNLTYAWDSSIGNGIFSDPTDQVVDVFFPSPGEYTIKLTVTDTAGFSSFITKIFTVDYVIHVMGDFAQNNGFTTLQAAFDWINLNDPGNDNLYTIHVWGTTLDAAIITANEAVVQFEEQGRILVSVVFPPNQSFVWNGHAKSGAHFNIETPDIAIQVNNGSALELNNISLSYSGATYVIDLNGFNVLTLNNVRILGTAGVTAQGTGGFIEIRNSEIITTTTALNLRNYELKVKDLYVVTTDAPTGIELRDCYGYISNTTVNSTQASNINSVALQIIPNTSNPLEVYNSTFKVLSFHAGFYQAGAAIINQSGLTRFSNCQFIGEDYGMIVMNNITIPSLFIMNSFIKGSIGSFITTSSYTLLTTVAFGPLNVYNNILNGTVIGATFAAGVLLSGENINV